MKAKLFISVIHDNLLQNTELIKMSLLQNLTSLYTL